MSDPTIEEEFEILVEELTEDLKASGEYSGREGVVRIIEMGDFRRGEE